MFDEVWRVIQSLLARDENMVKERQGQKLPATAQRQVRAARSSDWPQSAQHLAALAAILLATVVCYGNTLTVPFVLDDLTSVLGNPLVKEFRFSLRPRIVGDASFALNHALHGFSLAGYHLTNLLLHGVTGCLVYALGFLLLRTPRFAAAAGQPVWRLFPLLAALLFTVHPLQTQAVTYIAQRVTVLAALFYLASLCCYLLARQSGAAGRRCALLAGAVLAGLLAMLSKENAATLPLVMMLCELVLFPDRGRRGLLAPLGFLAIALVVPFTWALARPGSGGLTELLARISADAPAIPRLTYLATQLRVVVTYLRLLVLPVGQNLDYDYPLAASFAAPPVMASLALHLALLATAGLLLWRSRRAASGAAPAMGLAGFGIGWFYLALTVESSIFPIRDVIFEHRVYLPSVGICLAAAALVCLLRERLAGRPPLAGGVAVAAWSLVALLALATVLRNGVWGDEATLWGDVVRKSPGKARAHGSLARVFKERGRTAEAVAEYRAALTADPDDAAATNNLGTIFLEQGRYSSARRLFERATSLDPASAKVQYNLGSVMLKLGDLAGAEQAFEGALRLSPAYDQALNNLGLVKAKRGDYRAARGLFERAVASNPANRQAADNLAELKAAGF
jgi:tetratricopeptide (TPR) repeat protein